MGKTYNHINQDDIQPITDRLFERGHLITKPLVLDVCELIAERERLARFDELSHAWRRAPKDDNHRATDIVTTYLEQRLVQLQQAEGRKEGDARQD